MSLHIMMLTTKYTWLYRGFGALGCGLVILGIFLPWAAVTAGKIGPFSEGDAPSGWDMAYSQKNIGSSVNVAGAIFVTIFVMLAFAGIGLAVMLLGRNGASFSYFLISTSVFFLIFMLFLLPYVQQYIPSPEVPGGGQQVPSDINSTRALIQEWKDLKMAPLGGFYLSFAGAILAYVGSRLIVNDSARLVNYRKYAALLAQAHADGKVTTDEEGLLAKERELLKISRDEQVYLIRKTVPDPGLQERLIAMHDKPLDIEKILRAREFETYRRSLARAHSAGMPGQEVSDLLSIEREGLGISEADHDAIMKELTASGELMVPETKSDGPGPLLSMTPLPDRAPATPPPSVKVFSMPEPPSSERPSPGPPEPPVPPPAKPQEQLPSPPQKVSLLSGPGPLEPPKRVRCNKCGEMLPINTDERPLQLVCPGCGAAGTLK